MILAAAILVLAGSMIFLGRAHQNLSDAFWDHAEAGEINRQRLDKIEERVLKFLAPKADKDGGGTNK